VSRRAIDPTHIVPFLALTLVPFGVTACGGGGDAASGGGAATSADIRVQGFATPESVLHDTIADVYLVSNINGSPVERDGNGFISRVSPEGQVLQREWISGAAPGVTLNAPKGLAISDGKLYVADIDCVRMFDRESGAPAGEVCLKNATFLNDIAASPDGSMFFTDSGLRMGAEGLVPDGSDAVYRLIDDDRVVAVKKDTSLGAPNGIAVGSRGILVASFGSGEVYQLDAEGNRTDMMPASQRQLDGIVMLPDGGFMMSSWGDSAVYRVGGDGKVTKPVTGVEAPADIGYDARRNRVLIPLFNANEVLIHPLG
jgi:hypothetical protein